MMRTREINLGKYLKLVVTATFRLLSQFTLSSGVKSRKNCVSELPNQRLSKLYPPPKLINQTILAALMRI